MKRNLLLFFSLVFFLQARAQNTWIQKLYFQDLSPYFNNSDSLTGIKGLDIAADGDIYVLANYGKTNEQAIYKIDPAGSPVKWKAVVGHQGGLSSDWTSRVVATADSGCIIAMTAFSQSTTTHHDGIVRKYFSDGTIQWEQYFSGAPWGYEPCTDVAEIGSDFYAAVGDSVIRFDNAGNILGYDSSMTMPIQLMPNNDMIVRSPSLGLARLDQSGNVIWSDNTSGSCGCPVSYFYDFTSGSNTVSKIDLSDGSVVWSKTYPWTISDLDSTADGGFVASYGTAPLNFITSSCNCAGPGTIFRADLNGDTLWSMHYDFPYYGLPRIKMLPSGNIITGGAFIFARFNYFDCPRDYSSFLCMLDSSGHGVMETAGIVWPGDANQNRTVDFNDDALNVTIAWGSTGQKRDTIDWTGNLGGFGIVGIHSDIATDWPGVFVSGTNYKHADFNGDGVIDISDINLYAIIQGPFLPLTIPNWRLVNPGTFTSTTPDFNLFPAQDTVLPGSEIKYYLTLGNANVPVDSIYGLTFIFDCNYNLLTDTPVVTYPISDLGDPGTNLLGYDFNSFQVTNGRHVMVSRIDHTNAYQLNDTVAEITMIADPSISSLQILNMNVTSLNAKTYSEIPVQFNTLLTPVVIDPNAVNVEENIFGAITVYPSPANKELRIRNRRVNIEAATISIFNLIGEEVKSIRITKSDQAISIEDLPDGYYTGKISSDEMSKSFSFIVKH